MLSVSHGSISYYILYSLLNIYNKIYNVYNILNFFDKLTSFFSYDILKLIYILFVSALIILCGFFYYK